MRTMQRMQNRWPHARRTGSQQIEQHTGQSYSLGCGTRLTTHSDSLAHVFLAMLSIISPVG